MQSKKQIVRFESRSFRDSKRTPHAKKRTEARKEQRIRKLEIRANKAR